MTRSGWTNHPDTVASCPNHASPVNNNEQLARLLHDKIYEPNKNRFKISELFPPNDNNYSNQCGLSDGISVDRSDSLDDATLAERTEELAGSKRKPMPPVFALASKVRSIVVPGEQAVGFCVYDDPIEKINVEHAIIRGSEAVQGKGKRRALRDRLVDVFGPNRP